MQGAFGVDVRVADTGHNEGDAERLVAGSDGGRWPGTLRRSSLDLLPLSGPQMLQRSHCSSRHVLVRLILRRRIHVNRTKGLTEDVSLISQLVGAIRILTTKVARYGVIKLRSFCAMIEQDRFLMA